MQAYFGCASPLCCIHRPPAWIWELLRKFGDKEIFAESVGVK